MNEEQLQQVREHYHALSSIRDVIQDRDRLTNGYIEKGPAEILQLELSTLGKRFPAYLPAFDLNRHRVSDGYNSTSLLAYIGTVLARLKVALESSAATSATQIRSFSYVKDVQLRTIIERDYEEIQKSLVTHCWKAAIILTGGCVEAILTDLLLRHKDRATAAPQAPKDKQTGQVKEIRDWGLVHLIVVSTTLELINKGVEKLSHSLREYRDLVHPSVEIRSKLKADEEEAKIAVAVLDMIHKDLDE